MANKEEIRSIIEDFLDWVYDKERVVLYGTELGDNLNATQVDTLINKYLDTK